MVFGVFVLAIVTLAVIAVRWGVRRDRLARAARAEQHQHQPGGASSAAPEVPATPGPAPDRGTP